MTSSVLTIGTSAKLNKIMTTVKPQKNILDNIQTGKYRFGVKIQF